MSKVKIKLNSNGVRELLKSDEIYELTNSIAQQVQKASGIGYEVEARTYPERKTAVVYPGTNGAKIDNSVNNTLVKALGSVKR